MIRARKGGPWQWLWDAYFRRKVRRTFRGLWIRGVLPLGSEPVLLYANHSTFWDGFLAHQLCKYGRWDGYALMEEDNLHRYPFLARVGAFSIRRQEVQSSLESLRYARSLLQKPGAAVVIFPEGVQRGAFGLPGVLERGVEILARSARVRCLPVAFRCMFLEHERPDALIELGEVHAPARISEMQTRLADVVRRVAAVESLQGFDCMLRGGRSVAERWDAVRGLKARN